MRREGNFTKQSEIRQLVGEAREKNEAAFARLLELYEPLLSSMTSKYLLESDGSEDREDIHQELRLAFYNAVLRFDLSQESVDFGFYAKVCLKNALVSRFRLKKGQGVEILPIEDVTGLYAPDEPSRAVIESESENAILRLIDENLSEYEKTVWNLYLDGKTPKQIAAELQRSAKSISNALSRIRAKLREAVGQQNT